MWLQTISQYARDSRSHELRLKTLESKHFSFKVEIKFLNKADIYVTSGT